MGGPKILIGVFRSERGQRSAGGQVRRSPRAEQAEHIVYHARRVYPFPAGFPVRRCDSAPQRRFFLRSCESHRKPRKPNRFWCRITTWWVRSLNFFCSFFDSFPPVWGRFVRANVRVCLCGLCVVILLIDGRRIQGQVDVRSAGMDYYL